MHHKIRDPGDEAGYIHILYMYMTIKNTGIGGINSTTVVPYHTMMS